MTEYIVDWDENLVIDTFSKNSLREKIVRCCDCKHYEYWEFRDGRTAHDCARGGDYLFDTEPDGFCAWGVRRDA